MEAFSKKPWISLDQIDENGVRAEVQVTEGIGRISEFSPSKTGNAYTVKFEVDNHKHGVSGHFPKGDPILPHIEKAEKENSLIGFRVERWRQKHVDRKTPFKEVFPPNDMATARENGFKGLVAVYPDLDIEKQPKGENAVRSPKMKTRFEEDPVSGSAGDPYDVDLETFTGKSSKNGVSTEAPVYKPTQFEAPPFNDKNNDGSLNLGGAGLGVPLNILFFVTQYCQEREINLTIEEQERVAEMALKLSNSLQKRMYATYYHENPELPKPTIRLPNLSVGSHTRARQIIFELIKASHPITEDLKDDESFKKWGSAILKEGLSLWEWSLKTAEPFIE